MMRKITWTVRPSRISSEYDDPQQMNYKRNCENLSRSELSYYDDTAQSAGGEKTMGINYHVITTR